MIFKKCEHYQRMKAETSKESARREAWREFERNMAKPMSDRLRQHLTSDQPRQNA